MKFLRLARVADVHPEDHSVDIVMVDDGSRFPGVQVLTLTATTNSGMADLPDVTKTGEKWSLTESTDRDMIAIVGFLAPTVPIVLGFLFPQVNQVLFADRNRKIERHASDVYTSTDGDGNFELYHPSGTYLRIGTSPDHEDLAGKDYDAKWAITKNTDKAVHVHLRVSSAGAQKATLDIDPGGNVGLDHVGNLTTHTGGNATVDVDGSATITVGQNLSATVSGDASATVSGSLTSSAASWQHTGPVTIDGAVTINGNVATTGTLRNNGKSVGSTHTHGGVAPGAANTAVPN